MKKILTIFCLLAAFISACAQSGGRHVIGFYNVENLFDTRHDKGKNDNDFLPDGNYRWTPDKYAKKLGNIASVISAMRGENGQWHAVLGLAEVENRHCLTDLVARPELKEAGFRWVLREGPDMRGIDVALLYRPEEFKLKEVKSIPFSFAGSGISFDKTPAEQAEFKTRDILMVRGTIDGEMFAFFVTHLPSRLGDKGSDLRCRGAEIIYGCALALERKYPGIKVVVMGDMNDNPQDESMTEYLRARRNLSDVGPQDFFDPFDNMLRDGIGSLWYRGDPNIFDIIMVNANLANARAGSLGLRKADGKYYGRVFSRPFMIQQDGPYAGTPFRTFSRGEFIGGYSDHYPTYIVIDK